MVEATAAAAACMVEVMAAVCMVGQDTVEDMAEAMG